MDKVRSMVKTRQDNNLTNHTSTVYDENETELLRPIELGAVCDENQTGQQHDWLYKCDRLQKWY